jgi:hypothetical protein
LIIPSNQRRCHRAVVENDGHPRFDQAGDTGGERPLLFLAPQIGRFSHTAEAATAGLERVDLNIAPLAEFADVLMCSRAVRRANDWQKAPRSGFERWRRMAEAGAGYRNGAVVNVPVNSPACIGPAPNDSPNPTSPTRANFRDFRGVGAR